MTDQPDHSHPHHPDTDPATHHQPTADPAGLLALDHHEPGNGWDVPEHRP